MKRHIKIIALIVGALILGAPSNFPPLWNAGLVNSIGSGLQIVGGVLSATGGGSATGSGVDTGTGAITVTASCTLGAATGYCGPTANNHAIRKVNIGTLSGSVTITLDALANLGSNPSPVVIDDQGGNVTVSHTLTVTANASDSIANGSTGGSDGPFSSVGSISYGESATSPHNNWTREISSVIPPVAAISHQWLTSLSSVGAWGQTQPAFTDISGSASAAQMSTNLSAAIDSALGSTQGDILYRGASGWAALGPGTSGNFLQTQGASANPQWAAAGGGGGGGTIIANSIGGLVASNDSSTPNSVLDIASGTAADTTNAVIISPGAFTKSTAGSWASGSGSNGMGNGLTVAANTLYAVCLANNGGTPDYWFDTSFSCSHRPSGITDTKFRRVASFVTDPSSHILPFFQRNDTIIFKGQYTAAGSPLTFSATPATLALPVPPFSVATITVYNANASNAVSMIIYNTDASSTTGANGNAQCVMESSTGTNDNVCTIDITTDANSTITLVASGGSTGANIYVNTASFRDMRGQ